MTFVPYPTTPEELMEELVAVYPSREIVIRSEVNWDHLNSPETMEDFLRNRLFDPNLAQEFINNRHDRIHQIRNILKNHSPFSQAFTDIDFVDGRFIADGINHPNFASVPGLQASGGSNGTAIVNGLITSATTPRVSDDGLIIEGTATNHFVNNSDFDQAPLQDISSAGNVVPGIFVVGSVFGITTTVVGRGTDEDTGLPYMDLRYQGTSNQSTQIFLNTFTSGAVTASPVSSGDVYNMSVYTKRIAGFIGTGVSVALFFEYLRSDNGIANSARHPIDDDLSTTMTRYDFNITAGANAVKLGSRGFGVRVSGNASVNITLRVAGLQLTDTNYPQSIIFTDNNGVVTRTADDIRFNDLPILGLDPLLLGNGYTMYWEGFTESAITDATRTMWQLDDGTDTNRSRARFDSTSAVVGEAVDNGVVQGSVAVGSSPAARTPIKHAMRFKPNDFAAVVNGGVVSTDKTGVLEGGLTELRIGRTATGNPLNGVLQRLVILPEMTNEQLRAITQ